MSCMYMISDGNCYSVTMNLCDGIENAIQSLSDGITKYIGKLGDTHISIVGNEIVISHRLYEIDFDMPWVVKFEGTGEELNPVHLPSPYGGVRMKNTWKVPDSIILVFSSYNGKFYLDAIDSAGSTKKIPFPNVYDDGELCTGSLSSTDGMDCIAKFESNLADWKANGWNSDLYADKEEAFHGMVRFDESMNQLPMILNFSLLENTSSPVPSSILAKFMEG